MHPNFEHLMERAGLAVQHDGIVLTKNVSGALALETLLTLVVKECTNLLPIDDIRNEGGVHAFYIIREHFGVTPFR